MEIPYITPTVFICHSSADRDFGLQLAKDIRQILKKEEAVWIDESNLAGGELWENMIEHELKTRAIFIIILSQAAMESSWVKHETDLAILRGKYIIPVLRQNCELYEPLKNFQYISFNDDDNDLNGIKELDLAITHWEETKGNRAAYETSKSVGFFNPLPDVINPHFRGREQEEYKIFDYLNKEIRRLLTIQGRPGTGKTALIVDSVKSFITTQNIDFIIYISATEMTKVLATFVVNSLLRILSPDVAQKLAFIFADSNIDIRQKIYMLLEHFNDSHPRKTLLILDDFEQVIDINSQWITDISLRNMLESFVDYSQSHSIKTVIVTRIPCSIVNYLLGTDRQSVLRLEGLSNTEAKRYLRESVYNVDDISDEFLSELCERTECFPRALVALQQIIDRNNPTKFIIQLLEDSDRLLPNEIMELLVGLAFKDLSKEAQMVLQALSIYNHPVPLEAIDFLVKPFFDDIESQSMLNRLLEQNYVKRIGLNLYYLHSTDRDYSFASIEKGTPEDIGSLKYSRIALSSLAADYCHRAQLSLTNWNEVQEAYWIITELELRYNSFEFDKAAWLLLVLDPFFQKWGLHLVLENYYIGIRDKVTNLGLKAAVLINLGKIYQRHGETKNAKELFDEAYIYAKGRKIREREVLRALGNWYEEMGNISRALRCYNTSYHISKEMRDKKNMYEIYNEIGNCFYRLGKTERAIYYYKRAVLLDPLQTDKGLKAYHILAMGNCYDRKGLYIEAQDSYYEAKSLFEECQDLEGLGYTYFSLSEQQMDIGEVKKSEFYAIEGCKIGIKLKNVVISSYSYISLTRSYIMMGNLELAQEAVEQAIQCATIDNTHNILFHQGLIFFKRGFTDEARLYFKKALREVNNLLAHGGPNFRAFYYEALILYALYSCGNLMPSSEINRSFRQARKLCSDKGYIHHINLLMYQLGGNTELFQKFELKVR